VKQNKINVHFSFVFLPFQNLPLSERVSLYFIEKQNDIFSSRAREGDRGDGDMPVIK
jgi:hypothetical protein